MSKVALGISVACVALVAALSLRDPLAAVRLTAAQRSAGYRSTELEVNGENCRFCRINVERTLKDVAGVKLAKADMARHRALVIYDPTVVQPSDLVAAVRGIGVGAEVPDSSRPPVVGAADHAPTSL